ncbi:MAG: AAA family ATPase, partial [Kiritimatiellae bacterium]|nr:AAA family ATPase [Kiritimatiellia bacterium]
MALKKIVENILIDTVRIYGFRSLRDVTVSLGRFTLLTGMNNAGKTSFLRALNLALGVDRRSVDADDFYAGATEGKDGVKQEIVIDVRIIPVEGEGKRTSNFSDEWNGTVLGDIVRFDGKTAFVGLRTRVVFDEAKNEYALKRYSLKIWRDGVAWHEPDEAVESVFTGKLDHLAVFYMNAQRDLVADLRNRASYFGKMLSRVTFGESREKWEQTLAQMNDEIVKASPELDHLSGELKNVNRSMGEDGYEVTLTPLTRKLKDLLKGVNVEVQDHGSEAFTLDHHGMGTRSWAALLAYRAYVSWVTKQTKESEGLPYHPVLALEEPESHLHPNAQRQLCAQMAEMPGQLIVSTHSPYIAALAGLECIRHFTKAKSETSVRQVDVSGLGEEDIRRIRRDVLNTRGELLFARAVVLFEGETE